MKSYRALIAVILPLVLCTLTSAQRRASGTTSNKAVPTASLVQMTRDYLRVWLGGEALLWGVDSSRATDTQKAISGEQLARELSRPMRFSSATLSRTESLNTSYRPIVANWLQHLGVLGNGDAQFVFSTNSPIDFLDSKGQSTLFFPPISTGTVFNSLRTTERTRGAEGLTKVVLPLLRRMPSQMDGGEVKLIAVAAIYGVRNFLHETDVPEGEAVCIVADTETVFKFAKGDITDDELVADSDVYLAKGGEVSKVKMTFQ